MGRITLRLGPLQRGGWLAQRTSVIWLCEDGRECRAGDVVAFVRVHLRRLPETPRGPDIFREELGDLEVALVAPAPGRLTRRPEPGGYFNIVPIKPWNADDEVGWLETEGPARDVGLEHLMMSGRRASPLGKDGAGLLSGNFDRLRAWRIQGEGRVGNVLSMGVCEQAGVIQGEKLNFLELLTAIQGPAHVAFFPDIPLVPTARMLIEQIRRTDQDRADMRADLQASLSGGPVASSPSDWLFAGGLVQAFESSPITDSHDVLGHDGPQSLGRPDAIILSLHSEGPLMRRHRRLGYAFQCHNYLTYRSGPATRAWVSDSFERLPVRVEDTFRNYLELIDLIRESAPDTQFLICNRMSTSGYEDIQSYAAFDAPLGDTLTAVHDRELNLMLYDLARARDVAIIDTDAIGAELGGRRFMPDRLHQDHVIQAAVREEILRTLRARGVPGFAPAAVS